MGEKIQWNNRITTLRKLGANSFDIYVWSIRSLYAHGLMAEKIYFTKQTRITSQYSIKASQM